MTNIQLYQQFASEETFKKTHKIPLGHLVTFANQLECLDDETKGDICYAVHMISEYRHKEGKIPEHQRKD